MDAGLRTMRAQISGQYKNARSNETINKKRASLPPQLHQPNLMIPSNTLQHDLLRAANEPLEVGFQGMNFQKK